jgi:hypothetical protein
MPPRLLVELAFHAFILRRAALDHTQLPVGAPRRASVILIDPTC